MGNCLTCFRAKASTEDDSYAKKNDAGNNNDQIMPSIHEPNKTYGEEKLTLLQANVDRSLAHSRIATVANVDDGDGGGDIENIPVSSTKEALDVTLSSQISDNQINSMFERYREEDDEDAILATGIELLCQDLQYRPEDFAILVLAWQLDASQMCRFTKTEFIQGLQKMGADSVPQIRMRLEQQIERLQMDTELFKDLYRFTFRFGLEPHQRTLGLDMACSLWRLVFTLHTPELLNRWLDFLTNQLPCNNIPKDTWMLFLNFAETCDINSYNDEEAWPGLFDDFVEFERHRLRLLVTQDNASKPSL